MTKKLKLTLPLPMSVNHIYGKGRYGNTFLKPEGKQYKEVNIKYIRKEVKKQDWDKLKEGEYCYLDEVVYMNKAGRDADNLKKLTQDTITESKVVWVDDKYCLPRTNRIYIDKYNPRQEIVLTPTNTIGIFDTKEEYEEFLSCCNNSGDIKSGEVWVNELRLKEHNNKGGWAANANLNIQLSDFGSVNATGRYVRTRSWQGRKASDGAW